jgi:hypothetical protein
MCASLLLGVTPAPAPALSPPASGAGGAFSVGGDGAPVTMGGVADAHLRFCSVLCLGPLGGLAWQALLKELPWARAQGSSK